MRRILVSIYILLLTVSAYALDWDINAAARILTRNGAFNVGHQYAVVIGIDAYKSYPAGSAYVSEAQVFRSSLTERYYFDKCFELYNGEATASSIRTLFESTLPEKVQADDTVLLFYAGRSYLDESKHGYWIAADGGSDTSHKENWISNEDVCGMLDKLKAKRLLIISDGYFKGGSSSRTISPVDDANYYRSALQMKARVAISSGASQNGSMPEFGSKLVKLVKSSMNPLLDAYSIQTYLSRAKNGEAPIVSSLSGDQPGASFAIFRRSADLLGSDTLSDTREAIMASKLSDELIDAAEAAQTAAATVPIGSAVAASSDGTPTPSANNTTTVGPTGDIFVRAEDGAEVSIDGVRKGEAPILIKKLSAGRLLRITVSKGDLFGSAEVTLEPGELREFEIKLSLQKGNLLISVNTDPCQLWVDGNEKGPLGSGVCKGLGVGIHVIELKSKGLYSRNEIVIKANETTELKTSVHPVGSIEVDAPKGAKVIVDGAAAISEQPFELEGPGLIENISVGDHVIKAGGPDFMESSSEVIVAQGEKTRWAPYRGGAIQVLGNPAPSTLSLDGATDIAASEMLKDIVPGRHRLVIKRPGYQDLEVSSNVELGKLDTITSALVRYKQAVIHFPNFGIDLAPSCPEAEAQAMQDQEAGTAGYLMNSCAAIKIGFTSPYAESLDIQPIETSFGEGEERKIDISSGSIFLPWLPKGAIVSIGSAKSLILKSESENEFRSQPLPPGEYSMVMSIPTSTTFQYSSKVKVIAGTGSKPENYVSEISDSLANAKNIVVAQKAKLKGSITTHRIFGWTCLLGGITSGVFGTLAYLDGKDAYTSYTSTCSTSDAASYREKATSDSESTTLLGSLGLACVASSIISFATTPKTTTYDAQIVDLNRQIKLLASLEATK